jgi:hypothetical protein
MRFAAWLALTPLQWRQDFADIKEIEEVHKKFRAENEWKPRTVNGVDCGDWVSKKDNRPRDELVYALGYQVGWD